LECEDQGAHKGIKVSKEVLGLQGLKEYKDFKVQQDQKDPVDLKDPREIEELGAPNKGLKVQKDQLEDKDL
jgi:hypothetical protein